MHDPIVLVTGANGQVGRSLRAIFPNARYLAHRDLDVTDAAAVTDALVGSEVVVHLAAVTEVDRCEQDPELAREVNARGTQNVVEAAATGSVRVIYLSTDYVFDGTRDVYTEEDEPSPLNRYGESKLEGERHVLSQGERGLVVRTSWVIGEGKNFVRTVLGRAEAGEKLQVVDDQVGRPTFSDPLADALVHLIRSPRSGVLHVAGDGEPCTWADLADSSLTAAGLDVRVERVTTSRFIANATSPIAPRPARSVLSLEKARALGIPLLDWRQSLPAYVETLT